MHVEKFGNTAVNGIELGKVYVFPKLDGTNSSVWTINNGIPGNEIMGGSRTRQLSLESDNAGFYAWVLGEDRLINFLIKYPNLRLFGEWLVPHTFKGYREDAWRRFYVFDVMNNETDEYLSYDAYKPMLDEFHLDYIPPLAIIKNASYENFLKILDTNKFLCPDEGEPGEGIVIKNYDYYNRFGNQVWAKVIKQEFKDAHYKAMGAPEINMSIMNEEHIVAKACTLALVEKSVAKITTEKGEWSSKAIPELFGRMYYDIIKEELFDCLKEIKFGAVNFKTLKAVMINKIKILKPELF